MFTSKLMGLMLFVVGLFLLVVAVYAALTPIGIGLIERVLMFGAGILTCAVGYYMAARQG